MSEDPQIQYYEINNPLLPKSTESTDEKATFKYRDTFF
jgi:hypothetical protein